MLIAPVAELVDALDSKSSSARSAGSIPARGTIPIPVSRPPLGRSPCPSQLTETASKYTVQLCLVLDRRKRSRLLIVLQAGDCGPDASAAEAVDDGFGEPRFS